MKSNFKTAVSAAAVVCLMLSMLGACTQVGTERTPGQNDNRQLQNMQTPGYDRNNLVNTTPQLRQGNGYGTNLGDNLNTNPGMNQANGQQATPNRQKADNIKRQLMNMNGVENVDVMVMGNTALVGIKTRGNTGDASAMRDSITRKVKEIDNTITNVTVSESPDIMNRMNRLGGDITNNRPVNNITEEFNNMIRGITPEG